MMDEPHHLFDLDETLAFEHAALRDALGYWDRKRGTRALPARADIDPLELAQHLGWIILTDVIGDPVRLRYRLIGTEITRRVGRDSTGKYLDELYPPETFKEFASSFLWVVAHRRPMRATGTLWFANRDWLSFEAIDLPLAGDDGKVAMIMTRAVINQRWVKRVA